MGFRGGGMTPEQEARQEIDRQLEAAGWIVQDYRDIYITAGLGVAVHKNCGHIYPPPG